MLAQFRRSFLGAATFVRRAYAATNALSSDEFHLRPHPDIKALLEEVLPLAALVKHLDTPGLAVRCRYFGGNSAFDAKLRFEGNAVRWGLMKAEYHVEVTTAVHPKDYLRREALARHGAVYGGPGICRTGSPSAGTADVHDWPVAVYGGMAASLATRLTVERMRVKASCEYPHPCILVVNVVPEKRLSLAEWAALGEAAAEELSKSPFVGGYVVHTDSNTVLEQRHLQT